MNTMKLFYACLAATVMIMATETARADVVLSGSYHYAYAMRGDVTADDAFTNTDLSSTDSVTADLVNAGSSIQDGYAVTDIDRSQTAFDYYMTHSRPANSDSEVTSMAGTDGSEWFSVNVPTNFTISGFYFLTAGTADMEINAYLRDATDPEDQTNYLFNETYTDYEVNSEYEHAFSGSGLLLPGHAYEFYYGAATLGYGVCDTAMSTSNVVLGFTPVPEPGTFALLAFAGLAALGTAWLRRRTGK